MYGINLKYKTLLYGAIIGSFCGGLIMGVMKIYIYAFPGSGGLFVIPSFYPSHVAIDHYNYYKEDIAFFAEMGFKAYRMSINWPRIYLNGFDDEPNELGLQHYDDVFDECHIYGIELIVTIPHYETPLSMVKQFGSWKSRDAIDCYMRYCETIFRRYKEKVKYWLTFNEINCMSMDSWMAVVYRKMQMNKQRQ